MNIPPEVARAQAHHGLKGAAHGIKGGRPRLVLTDDERTERRRAQQEAYRRRNGIPPKKAGMPKQRPTNGMQDYITIWGKRPGEPFTPEEFAEREPLWNAKVIKQQEAEKCAEAEKQQRKRERQKRIEERGWQYITPSPVAATPSVGRNQPCPCGSGRKFKKCCGR